MPYNYIKEHGNKNKHKKVPLHIQTYFEGLMCSFYSFGHTTIPITSGPECTHIPAPI